MRQPVQVAIYLARHNLQCGWEYLILHRTPERGGFWQGVTGGVEEGEGVLETALREVEEETGLVPIALEKIDYTFSFPLEDKFRSLFAPGVQLITEYSFAGQVDPFQEPKLSHEHSQYRWCPVEEACKLLKWPENIEALRRCHEIISSKLWSK